MKQVKKLIILYIVFLLQSLIFENFKIFITTPDILVTCVIITALYSSSDTEAALIGAFAGLLKDTVCSRVFGVYILTYMLLAAAASHFTDKSTNNSPLITGVKCFEYTAVFIIVSSLFPIVFGYRIYFGRTAVNIVIGGLISFLCAMLTTLVKLNREKKKTFSKEAQADE